MMKSGPFYWLTQQMRSTKGTGLHSCGQFGIYGHRVQNLRSIAISIGRYLFCEGKMVTLLFYIVKRGLRRVTP